MRHRPGRGQRGMTKTEGQTGDGTAAGSAHPAQSFAARASSEGLGALTVVVDDLDAQVRFYRDVLGLRLAFSDDASAVFLLGSAALNLLTASEAVALMAPAASAPVSAVATQLLTVWVDDVDAACADLAARGVGLLNGPVDRPWGKRTAAFRDPAGLVWELAQDV